MDCSIKVYCSPSFQTPFAVWTYLSHIYQLHPLFRYRFYPPQTLFFDCFCHTYCHFPILGETAISPCTLPRGLDTINSRLEEALKRLKSGSTVSNSVRSESTGTRKSKQLRSSYVLSPNGLESCWIHVRGGSSPPCPGCQNTGVFQFRDCLRAADVSNVHSNGNFLILFGVEFERFVKPVNHIIERRIHCYLNNLGIGVVFFSGLQILHQGCDPDLR